MKTKAQTNFIKVVKVGESIPSEALMRAEQVKEYWDKHVATREDYDPDKEHLYVFILDTKYKIKGVNLVSIGSLNEAIAHPREIFRPIIALAGFAFILCHNHPSGDPSPSNADTQLVRRLMQCADLMQIRFLDSVIIGGMPGQPYHSSKETGLM